MSLALKENISDRELIEGISSFDVTDFDLMRDLEISEPTLRKYRKDNGGKKVRNSEPRMKLIVLYFTLNLAKEKGYKNTFEAIKEIFVKETPLLKFINENASENLIIIVIEQALSSQLAVKSKMNPIDEYREKYQYLNEDTLSIATEKNPELLKELVEDTELRPSTRADVLEALSVGGREDYFEFVKSKIVESAPHIREAAYNGLYEYYDSDQKYSFLKEIFQENLQEEKAEGVRATVTSLLEEMQAS